MYVPEEINSSTVSNILVGPIMCINFASKKLWKIRPKDKKEQNVYLNVYLHQNVRKSLLKYLFTAKKCVIVHLNINLRQCACVSEEINSSAVSKSHKLFQDDIPGMM